MGEPQPTPSPRRGEGWGEGDTAINGDYLIGHIVTPHPPASRATSPRRGEVKRADDRQRVHHPDPVEETPMEMRNFGRTGLRISILGFGCGAVGGLMVRGAP